MNTFPPSLLPSFPLSHSLLLPTLPQHYLMIENYREGERQFSHLSTRRQLMPPLRWGYRDKDQLERFLRLYEEPYLFVCLYINKYFFVIIIINLFFFTLQRAVQLLYLLL